MESHQEDYQYSRNMNVIKGKRTKRPRPSSPLALTMASTSTTTTASDDGDNSFFHMPTIEFSKLVQENNEEDMMANCLILLASSSPSQPSGLLQKAALVVEAERKSGLSVYECKTCNRGFSSFQALGGHRASHKKPSKPNMVMKVLQDVDNIHSSSTTLSLQIGSNYPRTKTQCNPAASTGSIKVAKIHDCSICGAEFGSGQALGGHMRRHRSMPPMATANCGDSGRCQEYKKPKTTQLSLDLNLPAPIEDDHRESTKFPFRSKDQMIVFSNSSLVHCHKSINMLHST